MTIDGNRIGEAIELAMTLGSVLLTVMVCAVIFMMIRPKTGAARQREADPAEAEELWRIVDVMEARLEVLERALADQVERPRERDFLPAKDGRDPGRTQ